MWSMGRMLGSVATVLGGAVLGAVLLASPAAAQTTIGTFEGSIPIETFQGSGVGINRIVVEAQEPGSVVMEFDDVVLSEQRSWERVDVGTTPYTLLFRIQPDPAVIRYEGDMVGERQEFAVALRASGLDDQPRAGFVTYTFVPDSAEGPEGNVGIRQGVAARVRLGAWPADLDGVPARVTVSDLRLERDRDTVTGIIDRMHSHRASPGGPPRMVEVIDFKTDAVDTPAVLLDRHRAQMLAYGDAVRRLFPDVPVSLLLVSTNLQQAVPVAD